MINKMLKKIVILGIIGIIFQSSFPIVISNENIIYRDFLNKVTDKVSSKTPIEIPIVKPSDNGDIIFKVFGFMRFFVVVENNRDEQITVYVNYTMKLGTLGANSTIFPFPVEPRSSTFIFWDCQPMPMYFIKITCEAAGEKYTKYGFTILGFNFFYPDQ